MIAQVFETECLNSCTYFQETKMILVMGVSRIQLRLRIRCIAQIGYWLGLLRY